MEFEKGNFDHDKEGFKEAYKELQKGNTYYKSSAYSKALLHYLKANDFNPDNALLNVSIGHCYLNSSQKFAALPYLEKAIKLKTDIDVSVHFLLGKAYHLSMEWDRAIKEYERYMDKADVENNEMVKMARKKIEECKFGKELAKNVVKVKIENLGSAVNSTFAEYCPLISADESLMIFTSRRDNTTGGKKDPNYDVYYEDIYVSRKKEGKWSEAINIGEPLNTDFHDATVGLAPDGQKLFIYKDDGGDGNIYECELDGDKWSLPVKLNEKINTKYTEPSACFSYDGRTIYFVSDRRGGFGEKDVYVSRLMDDGQWGKANNLGAVINTQYNEEAVFMHPDGKTLYFSSLGHNTMGGYDIFKSVYDEENNTWSTPENLGYPINTSDDDVFFVLAANGMHGYYSSIKAEGFGEKDIYMVTFLEDETKPQLTLVKGKVVDNKTLKPIGALIEVIDNDKNEIIANTKSNKLTGDYLISLPSGKNYGISITADGYFFQSENIDIPASTPYFEIIKEIELDQIAVGKSIVLHYIFFDFNKATLKPASIIELERVVRFMEEYPSLRIEISGHTDNKGTRSYNQQLSEQRAKTVVDYLVNNNIDNSRLVYAGYGFKRPIANNDTEEGMAKNRRTEFKVIEFDKKEKITFTAPPVISSGEETSQETISPVVEEQEPDQTLPDNPQASQNIENSPAVSSENMEKELPVKTKESISPEIDHSVTSSPNIEFFSSDKQGYYNSSNLIPIDPELPSGVIYKIQIGAFSKRPDPMKLKGLYPIHLQTLPKNIYRCSVGIFKSYTKAKEAQQIVRDLGFSDAFLIAFYNGEKISVSQAVKIGVN
ncbi:MAG: OmpA family protein [Bacteroidota bacterium]